MSDILEKVQSQLSKPSGPRAPGASGGSLEGPKPVLDNQWGTKLTQGGRSLSIGGGRGKK